MTGRIISLHGDLHDDAYALLPWYVTGRLDAEDTALVEAHLAGCAQCQADLVAERRLQAAVAELPEATGDADTDFDRLRQRLAPQPPRLRARLGAGIDPRRMARQWRSSAPWLRWTMAAQLALLIAAGAAFVLHPPQIHSAAQYRTLSSAPESAAANIVVVFRPDVRESDLRRTLRDSHARLVDGPTAADAYLLHVPADSRAAAVARLRAESTIVLAEPVDAGDKP